MVGVSNGKVGGLRWISLLEEREGMGLAGKDKIGGGWASDGGGEGKGCILFTYFTLADQANF